MSQTKNLYKSLRKFMKTKTNYHVEFEQALDEYKKLTKLVKRQKCMNLSICEQAINAVENRHPSAVSLTKKYLSWLLETLDELFPSYRNNDRLDLKLSSDDETQQLVANFASLANSVACTKNVEVAGTIYTFFSDVCERYKPDDCDENSSGHDFYRFLGHEMFVCFISAFVKRNQWLDIDRLLKQKLCISNSWGANTPKSITFDYASSHLRSFRLIGEQNNLDVLYLHANVLKERHCREPLSSVVSAEEFMEADFLLRLSRRKDEMSAMSPWFPHSAFYLNDCPQYLRKAVSLQFAEQLLPAFNLHSKSDKSDKPDISEFRAHLSEKMTEIKGVFNPDFDNTNPPFLIWAEDFNSDLVGRQP